MTYKSILVPFTGDPGSDAALDTALKVAQDFDSSIELLHVQIDPVMALAGMGEGLAGATAGQVIESAEAAAEAKAVEARKLAEQSCRAAGWNLADANGAAAGERTAVWRKVVGRENEEIARRGRLSDLIVAPTPEHDESSAISGQVAAALFDTGRPVLIAPGKAPEAVGGKVAVAWNGSREAAVSVAAALPFILGAEKVVVICDDSQPKEDREGNDLLPYLARHGVAAERVGVPENGRSIGERLVYAAVTAGAELLVMGAYGHSRFRELVLGGATLGAFRHTTIPLLMAH
ncbi:MAG: universal stress protein [Rhodospirillales bacterium]|nr:universal stress protein [Rhodospirillales bacterium]